MKKTKMIKLIDINDSADMKMYADILNRQGPVTVGGRSLIISANAADLKMSCPE